MRSKRQSKNSVVDKCRHCGALLRRKVDHAAKRPALPETIDCTNCGLEYVDPGNAGSLPRPVGHRTKDKVVVMINSQHAGIRRRGLSLAKRATGNAGIVHGSITGRKASKAVAK